MKKLRCPKCNSNFIMKGAWLKRHGYSNIKKENRMCGMCGERFKHNVKEKVVFT